MTRIAAAFAALLLAAAPAAAQAQPPALDPASETAEGSEFRSGIYWVLPALIVIALLIAILAGDGGDEQPASP
jgi:hypothetical protein